MITEQQLIEMHDEMLDDVCGLVEIGNLQYEPARVLKEVDPTAYRISLAEYADSLMEDGEEVEGY